MTKSNTYKNFLMLTVRYINPFDLYGWRHITFKKWEIDAILSTARRYGKTGIGQTILKWKLGIPDEVSDMTDTLNQSTLDAIQESKDGKLSPIDFSDL